MSSTYPVTDKKLQPGERKILDSVRRVQREEDGYGTITINIQARKIVTIHEDKVRKVRN